MKNLYPILQAGMIILVMISSSFLPLSGQNLKLGQDNITITIGSGTKTCNYPFTTFWSAGRTQMLYTADEIIDAGGSPGVIKKIGFDVHTNDSIPMDEFNISIRNTSMNSLQAWTTDSMTTCYSGMYEVRGTGWQMILLHTPFNYDGRNLIVEVCYTSTASSNFSPVSGTDMPQQILTYYADGMPGCTMPATFQVTSRPDIRIIEEPFLDITTHDLPEGLKIYPNPADNLIKLNSDIPINEVKVINAAGQLVFTAKDNLSLPFEISTSGFPKGIYFIKVTTARGAGTSKISIQH